MSLRTLLAAAALLPLAATAQTAELSRTRAELVHFGPVSGIVYYTDEAGGYRVVATVASGQDDPPIRFEAVLAPGQSMTLSTPREMGLAPETVEIVRNADQVVLREPTLTN
jgi:hypothetical protein